MIFSILLTIMLILSVTVTFGLYKILKSQLYKIKIYERWVLDFQEDVTNAYNQMKELDRREIFSKDDDVGVAFTEILNILKDLETKIQK